LSKSQGIVYMNALPCLKTVTQVSPVAGCPSTNSTDENIEQVHVVILVSQQVTIEKVAYHLFVGHGLAHEIVHSGYCIVKCVYEGLQYNS
jgi:hypothetical protein